MSPISHGFVNARRRAMSLFKIAEPLIDPVTLDEAKQYLRICNDHEDDLIRSLITSATAYVELKSRNALITQSWRLIRNAWPHNGQLVVAVGPVQAVTAARVFDTHGGVRDISPAL